MLQLIAQGLYVHSGELNNNDKIAAFDLDWTIVRSIRGRFPKDSDDWAFLPNRLITLKAYYDANYTIAIFTNQGYKGAKQAIALERINKIISALESNGIKTWIFAATGDIYRKPNSTMWQVFESMRNVKIPINKNDSFYVGDAAGRQQDHSNDDINFAKNIGLTFYTPEQIFPSTPIGIPDTQTMFIFVGMPGSGKTTYYEQNLKPHGWIHANQDILKTQPKMLNTIRAALQSGKSIAVDATNPSADKRREYIMLAIQYQIPTLIIYFVRNGYEWNKLRQNPVPDIAYNMYYKNLVEPKPEIDLVPVVEIF